MPRQIPFDTDSFIVFLRHAAGAVFGLSPRPLCIFAIRSAHGDWRIGLSLMPCLADHRV